MNRALLSPRFLLPVFVGWSALGLGALALRELTDAPVSTARLVGFALAYSLLGCFVHEKIARCWSPLHERALRFGTLIFVVVAAPLVILGGSAFEPSTLVLLGGGWIASILGFAAPIHLLYTLDPKGGADYFSVSAKFTERV